MVARISCCLWTFPISDRDPDCMEKFAYTDTETLLWDYSDTEEHYVLVKPPARRVRTLYRVPQTYAYQWFGLNGGNNLKIIYYPFAQTHFRNLTNPCDCPPEEDAYTATVTVSPSSVIEDGGLPLVYTISLDRPSADTTTIDFTLTGTATESVDYPAVIPHSVTIAAGQTSAQVSITPTADAVFFEHTVTVILTLTGGVSGSGLINGGATATGGIVDVAVPSSAWQQPLSVPVDLIVRGYIQPPCALSYAWLSTASSNLQSFGWHQALSISAPSRRGIRRAESYDRAWLGASPPIVGTTLNPADKSANVTLSGGNLIATFSSASDGGVRSVSSKTSGKYYVEFTPGGTWTGADNGFGIALAAANLGTVGTNAANAAAVFAGANPPIWYNGAFAGVNLTATDLGTLVGMAVDLDNKKIWWKNYSTGNQWIGSATATVGDPAANTNGFDISALFPGLGVFIFVCANQNTASVTVNFGSSAFSQPVPSGFTAGWPA